jgi:hypothetical protein
MRAERRVGMLYKDEARCKREGEKKEEKVIESSSFYIPRSHDVVDP